MPDFGLVAAIYLSTIAMSAQGDGNVEMVPTDKDQVIKCRKVEVTGSLLKKGKVCRTAAEWRRIQDNGNRTARAIVEEGAKPTN